jgi:hypothetical protein
MASATMKTQANLNASAETGGMVTAFARYDNAEVHNAIQFVSSTNLTGGQLRLIGVRRA